MSKELILARSNFRKNRGTTIGVFLLILIAAMLTSLALLIALDVKPTAEKEAKRLNAGDGYIIVHKGEGITKDHIKELINDDVKELEFQDCVYYNFSQPIPFGDGSMSTSLVISGSETFDQGINRVEIVKEDTAVTAPYIYLPYQFTTSGGVKLGDKYSFELAGVKKEFTVRGFINTTYFGCNNLGVYQFVFDDASLAALKADNAGEYEGYLAGFALKDGVKASSFKIRTINRFGAENYKGYTAIGLIESTLSEKTFMSDILIISFLMVTVIIILVAGLMLSNSIKNYIRENMKNLGALRAIGYTSGNIRSSLILMFGMLSLIGGIAGGLLSYTLLPVMAGVFEGQAGVPYKAGLNMGVLLFTAVFIALFIVAVSLLASRRLKKIEVVAALRDGIENHNFRRNHVALETAPLSLNFSLAFKTMFTNLKQNITTFFVTGVLVFICVIGLLMYENFNKNPKLSILTVETAGGVVGVSRELAPEVEEFLRTQPEAENIRYLINMDFLYNDEEKLNAYILKDVNKFNNRDLVYSGRFPQHDNEIAVSGKFARDYGYKIGDEIKLDYGSKSFTYLITGLIQSCNNGGREALISEAGAAHIIDMEHIPEGIWFDCDSREEAQSILDACTAKYGDKLETTLNFYEMIEGFLTTFSAITTLMLSLMITISVVVIMLILYLFIKSLLYNKKKDYGIYKALGYTSKDLILQTAASFMPAIILSVIVFSVVSYFAANPYMQLIMVSFGMMKCTFAIPVIGVVAIDLGLIAVSFLFAIFQAGKIRKIEAYTMLTEC